MGEWASYSLGDFLMFSPQAYGRLIERQHAALWPLQLPALALGLALLPLTRQASAAPWRDAALVLAAAWGLTGWTFHWQRYAELFLAAPWLAAGCGAQAMLLLASAAAGPAPGPASAVPVQRHAAGLTLLAAAMVLYPLLAPASGQPWRQMELFGLQPDPTAWATLGWVLAAPGLRRWQRAALAVWPLASAAIGLATRWALAQVQ